MRRSTPMIAAVAVVALATALPSFALDPGATVGISGLRASTRVATGLGHPTDDHLARPGFSTRIGQGSVGVTSAGSRGGLNPVTIGDFHTAGMGKAITAGMGGSTMDTVPGRTPTYIHILTGTRQPPPMGSRAP